MKGSRTEKRHLFFGETRSCVYCSIFVGLTLLKAASEAAFQALALVYLKVWQIKTFVFANMGISRCTQEEKYEEAGAFS